MNTKKISEQSEATVLTKFLQNGYPVALPFGDNQRYDLIVDFGDRLSRVQVKVGRIKNGAITFDAHSSHDRQSYRGGADLFAVYVFELDQVYLLDVDKVPTTKLHLRLEPSKNKQEVGIRWASHFEFDIVLGA